MLYCDLTDLINEKLIVLLFVLRGGRVELKKYISDLIVMNHREQYHTFMKY